MAQITEDYVSFETAKLLKEKRFDDETPVNYFVGDDKPRGCVVGEMIRHKRAEEDTHLIACPTLWMAMKWLREVHNIHIELRVLKPYGTDGHHHSIPKDGVIYYAEILHIDKWNKDLEEFEHVGLSTKDTNEKACEAASKYCRENLI